MSGRLIITTKKTYCPWNAANVERVLRDERLERERLERQQSEENQSLKRQHEHEEGEPQGHINLFPEAREAEIRLTHGATDGIEKKNSNNGVLPVPLGGDELNNRKNGKVPFYMRAQSQSAHQQKYDNSAYRGMRGNRSGVASDEITDSLMRDQFASREEYRKQQNDPMNQFYVDSKSADKNIYAHRESSSSAQHVMRSNCSATTSRGMKHSLESQSQERGLTKSRKRKTSHRPDDGVEDNDSLSSSSSSSSLSSSTPSWDYRRRKRRRKHDSRKERSSKHSSYSYHGSRHRRKNSPLHSKKKRRKDKMSERKHRSKDWGEDDGDRQDRHHSSTSPFSPTSNEDLKERKKSDTHQLDDMRRRRFAREAKEMERQRQIIR